MRSPFWDTWTRHWIITARRFGITQWSRNIGQILITQRLAPTSQNKRVHPRTGHDGPEVEYMYSSTLTLTSALYGGWVFKATPRPLYKDPVPIVQEVGWAPGSVWTGVENIASTGIRSPDRPVRNKSLYRLSYPGSRRKETSANVYLFTLNSINISTVFTGI